MVPVASVAGAAIVGAVVVGVMLFRGAEPSSTRADIPTRTVARRAATPAAPAVLEQPSGEGTDTNASNADTTDTPSPNAPTETLAAAAKPAAKVRRDKVVDLMPMIDPAIASVAGGWHFEGDDLVSDGAKPATLQIPYTPPAEYDFRIEFTAGGTVQQHLFKEPASFSWAMGNTHDCGFEFVNGKHVWEAPFKNGFRLSPGKRHVSVVRVRNNRVQGYIDNQLLVDAVTDFKNFSKNPELAQPDNSRLGLGSYNAPARFHKIEVIEIKAR
jgi:hypothetical protein